MRIAGIDEAGRGSVIGPLVICGVVGDPRKLAEIGVRDSKMLAPSRREYLAERILELIEDYRIVKIEPKEIDEARESGLNLNEIEARKMAEIIDSLNPDRVYVDCVDANPRVFVQRLRKHLRKDVQIVAMHGGERHPLVAAASILAKVERDREIARLRERFGDFNSGYPSDEKTREFLERIVKEDGEMPSFVRRTWKTVRKLRDRRLDDFIDLEDR